MLFVIMNEHPSQPIDYATVPGAWNFRHFNDSSRQLVHPTLLEFGLDELVQLQTASIVGRADAEGGQRRNYCDYERRGQAACDGRPVGKASGAVSIATVIRGSTTGEQERTTVGGSEFQENGQIWGSNRFLCQSYK
ncbi:MAG: hypothetical protein ABSH35_37240 [Isosphaeraceae bacterium]